MKDEMKLKDFDRQFAFIKAGLDYQKYMTPVNFNEENSLFLKHYSSGRVYNPQYTYERFSPNGDFGRVMDDCISFTQDCSCPMAGLMHKYASELKKEIQMYRLIGNDDSFSEIANSFYGVPERTLAENALEVLKNTPTQSNLKLYSAEELKATLQQHLQAYGFAWDFVLASNMASRVSVEPEQKKIYINSKKTFTRKDVIRLQVHEIDTHVLRCENGERQGFSILSSGTAGSLIHEEGLALYNEEQNGVQDAFVLKLYAARFLVCCNIEKSFFDNFDMLISLGCDQETAIYVVSRIKRGLSDTAKPGGFIKDYVYFQGYHEVKSFVESNPQMYPFLYYGAISIDDVMLLHREIASKLQNGDIILPKKQS